MDVLMKDVLWKQFGAAIEMLENAIIVCPETVWDTPSQIWYKAYHTLFYLDYYLTEEPEQFMPPPPFTLSEFDPAGIMPERVYSKEELLDYLTFCRNKCRLLVTTLTSANAKKRWTNLYRNYSILEILIYNMRHVQHHAAQINLLLRQEINKAPNWVSQTAASL